MKATTASRRRYLSEKARDQWMRSLPEQFRDFSNWPQFNESSVPEEHKKRFRRLVKAADMLLKKQPMEHVLQAAGVGERRFWQLMNTALTMRRDAPTIQGTRAFVYRLVQRERERSAPEGEHKACEGFGGLFKRFTRAYPKVMEQLIDFLNGEGRPNQVTPHVLHVKFQKLLVQAGVPEHVYPRNTKSKAYKPLMHWYDTVYKPEYLMTHIRREHGEAAAVAAGFERGDGQARTPPVPYLIWVIDECRINLDATTAVPMAIWDVEHIFLRQFPILRCRSIGPVACNIAWHMCLRAQASGDDVIQLFKRAVMGQPAVDSVAPEMQYEPGAGFPQNVFPKLRFAVPLVIYLDNALSHLYNDLQFLVTRLYGGRVVLGAPGVPKGRPDIESAIGSFLTNLVHQFPNASGTGPLDAVRKKSATTAERAVPVELLEQAADVYFANENVLPSAGAGHLSAFTRLAHFVDSGQVQCNYLPEVNRHGYRFCAPKPVKILCNLEKGRLPYINYDYRRYSSQWLKTQPALEGKRLWASADSEDLRTVILEEEDGSQFGTVTCEGMWGRVPHDRRMLAIYAKHRADAQFLPRPQDGPLFAVLDHLKDRGRDDRDAALDYAYVVRFLKRHAAADEIEGHTADRIHGDGPESAEQDATATAPAMPADGAIKSGNVVQLPVPGSSVVLRSPFSVPRR